MLMLHHAQAPAVLLLDELTSFLDAGDQASVLAAVRAAVDASGVTAVWVRSTNPKP
jgi:ABC-type cobalamin/Fe3+-siderophores transport system ATPase subunit